MLCLDEEYHPIKELTTAQYEALTTAQQNNGTIYIQTDAETTGEDISVSSTDTRTIDEGIADADGQIIDYATWQTMTPQEQEEAGKVFVPDFPTATPNATEIPMSSSDNTSVAAAIASIPNLNNISWGYASLDRSSGFTDGGCRFLKIGKLVIISIYYLVGTSNTQGAVIFSGIPKSANIQTNLIQKFGTNYEPMRVRISETTIKVFDSGVTFGSETAGYGDFIYIAE